MLLLNNWIAASMIEVRVFGRMACLEDVCMLFDCKSANFTFSDYDMIHLCLI